jgi:hypothetical protein
LKDLYEDEPLPQDAVVVFDKGENFTLEDGVYDLRARAALHDDHP